MNMPRASNSKTHQRPGAVVAATQIVDAADRAGQRLHLHQRTQGGERHRHASCRQHRTEPCAQGIAARVQRVQCLGRQHLRQSRQPGGELAQRVKVVAAVSVPQLAALAPNHGGRKRREERHAARVAAGQRLRRCARWSGAPGGSGRWPGQARGRAQSCRTRFHRRRVGETTAGTTPWRTSSSGKAWPWIRLAASRLAPAALWMP